MALLSARQNEDVMAEINITPFTDVLLVLLIIFMILAAIVTPPGFEKSLPNSGGNPTTQHKNKNDINVMVTSKGVIFVDGTRADTSTIYSIMYAEAKKKPGKHVALAADAKAPYGVIIRILDAAQDAGLNDVGFVTG